MPADELTTEPAWTIGRLLTWTTDFLKEKGSESPRLDAEVLLAHARKCQRIELYTAFEEETAEAVRSEFRELVRRRAAGAPVAYLVGHREFFSLDFDVSPDVLIPRPETELLVVRMLDLAKTMPVERALQIADVGTGSGVLAVCCAKHLPDSKITALDISGPALALAQRNAAKHGVNEQIEFLESDLFNACPAEPTFDAILSNPPYVASAEMAALEPEVRDHEPHQALDGGEQGVEVIEHLIPQATVRLRPGGWLLMEVSPMNAARVEQIVSSTEGLTRHDTTRDLAGLPRVVQAQRC